MRRFLITILLLLPTVAWAGQGMFPTPMVYQGGGDAPLVSITGGTTSRNVADMSDTRYRCNVYEGASTLSNITEIDFDVVGYGNAGQFSWVVTLHDADSTTSPLGTLLETSTNSLTSTGIPADGVSGTLTFTFSGTTDLPQNGAICLHRSDGGFEGLAYLKMQSQTGQSNWSILTVHSDGYNYFTTIADNAHNMEIRD